MSYRRALNLPYCHHIEMAFISKCQSGHKECSTRIGSIEKSKRTRNSWIACSLIIIYRSTFAMKNIQEIVFPLLPVFCTSKGCFFTSPAIRSPRSLKAKFFFSTFVIFPLIKMRVCSKHKLQWLSVNSLKASEAKRKCTVAAMAQAFWKFYRNLLLSFLICKCQ